MLLCEFVQHKSAIGFEFQEGFTKIVSHDVLIWRELGLRRAKPTKRVL
jgi:hypothetical protein